MKKTKIIKANDLKEQAIIKILYTKQSKQGQTVVFPTETVYGIGADALNPKCSSKKYIMQRKTIR